MLAKAVVYTNMHVRGRGLSNHNK